MTRESYQNFRLTDEQQALIKNAAEAAGLKPSEFCRQAAVAAARNPHPVLFALIEEVLALRLIVSNVVVYLTTDGKDVNRTGLTSIAARADEVKSEKARRLLDRLTTATSPEK